jgi:SprT protein
METKINKQINKYQNIIKKTYNFKLDIEEVLHNIKGSNAGQAKRVKEKYYLRFNPSIYNIKENEFEYLNNTVAHEFAHLVVFELERRGLVYKPSPHGKEWQKIMKSFKVPSTVTHNFKLPVESTKTKYKYECKCKIYFLSKIRHNKILKGHVYSCKKCKQPLSFTNSSETFI